MNKNKTRAIKHVIALTGSLSAISSHYALGETVAPTLDNVVVLGSRSAESTVLKSRVPVDVIQGAEIQKLGYSNINQALQALAPSINFGQSFLASTTAGVRSIQMRGLSPDQVLILVNGKRRHSSAQVMAKGDYTHGVQQVDLNTIPLSAIERVEILRDGASAQYGSDAIAGVINIVLKERDSGGGAKVKGGEYSQGTGFNKDLQLWKGIALPGDGFLTLSGQARHQQPVDAEFADSSRQYAVGDPREATADRRNRASLPETDEFNLAFNSEVGLTDALRLYGFATYDWRSVEAGGAWRAPNNRVQNVPSIYPDGFTPVQDARSKDIATTVGARYASDLLGDLDLSATYGQNTMDYTNSNSLNASYGTSSPTKFYLGELENKQLNINLDDTKKIDIGLAQPATLGGGLMYRKERYEVSAGDHASWDYCGLACGVGTPGIAAGAQGYTGWAPQNEGKYNREVYGAYASIEVKPTDKLSTGLAGRYEDYSDFGSTTTGSFSARYDFTPAVAVRGNIGTGFRAPSIGQLGFSAISPTWIGNTFYNVLNVPVSNPIAQALGAKDLKPEKSTNYSAGIVLRPDEKSSVSLDFYQIDIKDRITLTDNLLATDPSIAALLTPYPGIGGASFFVNGVDTQTRGLDLVGKRKFSLLGTDDLVLSLAYNRSKTTIEKLKVSEAILGKEAQSRITDSTPKDKLILGADYAIGQWQLSLQQIRYGEYKDVWSPAVNVTYPDQTYRPQWTTDMQIKYNVDKNINVTLGGTNIFSSHSERSDYLTSTRGGYQRYSIRVPTDRFGAAWYLAAEYDF